jgi:Fe-S-cluster containining protein
MAYPCTGCGACCRRVHFIPQWPKEFIKEDGSCVYLKEDNSCAIYEQRPSICRVDEMMKKFEMEKEEFYSINIEICNNWMEEDGMTHLKIENPQ